MKLRKVLALFAVVAIAACGGAADEPAADTAAATSAAEAPMDDVAAIAALRDDLVTHYNMHHASVVGGYHTEDGVLLAATGSVFEGRDAIVAALEEEMAMSPTLAVDIADTKVSGDMAAAYGGYSVDMAPEGADAFTLTGNWMAAYAKVNGDWKIAALLTNYDSEPAMVMPVAGSDGEPPAETVDSPLAEVTEFYARHFNMGHGGVVASRFAEDGVAAFADSPLASGRAAVEELLSARMEEGGNPQLTIHEVAVTDMGDGWFIGGGWYELAGADGNSTGAYMLLCRADADGEMQIHWAASNGVAVPE